MSDDFNISRVKEIVGSALDLPADERERFIINACGTNAALLAEVRATLAAQADASAAGFLSSPDDGATQVRPVEMDASFAPIREGPGQHIGPYKLLQLIGEGGFGSVFMAEQQRPMVRKVALKIIKLGMDTRAVIARFEAERQALAIMDHANIARVLDAGTTETGRPYFVMELVRGEPITEYADRNHLSVSERIDLFAQVCNAVQHAHQKGIIHRDIKPSNVLVSTQDGRPFAKVIDFGIAKAMATRLTEKTLFTEHKQLIGTPQYMSPEQADGSFDIDTRTDIYSLGVVLYELLTGSTPFDAKSLRSAAYDEMRRIIREVDPPKPSTRISELHNTLASVAAQRKTEPRKLSLLMRGELDWIVMRALDKDRSRRYATPNDLAADLGRHLAGEPVQAAPPSVTYRVRKFARRYRAAIVTFSTLMFLLLAAVLGTSFGLVREHRALAMAEKNRVVAEQASKRATDEAALALAAKNEADVQASHAKKSALLSDAQYLIQQSELPEALDRIQQADQIGLAYDDRLVLNQFMKSARDKWTLIGNIDLGAPIHLACLLSNSDEEISFAGASKKRLFARRIFGDEPLEQLPIKYEPSALVPIYHRLGDGDQFVAVFSKDLQLYGIAPLRLIKGRIFSSHILMQSASGTSIVVALADGTIHLIDAQTLEDRETWKWGDLQKYSGVAAQLHLVSVSPDDRFVVLHSGAWNVPTVVIDRQDHSTHASVMRMHTVAFAQDASNKLLTWFAPGAAGGAKDEFCQYDLPGGKEDFQVGVTNDQTKEPKQICQIGEDYILCGAVGVTRQNSFDQAEGVRYTRMWPVSGDAPEFACATPSGNVIAISTAKGLAVFTRSYQSLYNTDIQDWCSCVTADGLYSMQGERMLVFQPFSPSRQLLMIRPQQLEGGENGDEWYPWGLHISADGKQAAILEQDTNGSNTISATYGQRVLLLYDLSAGVDKPESWVIRKQIPIPELAGINGFNNRFVRFSPDGKVVTLCITTGAVLRFDVATGKCIGRWHFQPYPEISSDGQYLAAVLPAGHDLVIYRITDGSTACTIKKISSMRGGCFTEDNSQFIVSQDGTNIEAYDLKAGELAWSKPSRLIPRAWADKVGRFAGLQQEDTSAGAKLMLADINTGLAVATISPFAAPRNDVHFCMNDAAIYCQRDRWTVEVTRLWQLSDLQAAITTPCLATRYPWTQPEPALVKLIEQPKPAAGSVVDASKVGTLTETNGVSVKVVGEVAKAVPTQSGGHLNLFFEPEESGLMLFIQKETLADVQKQFGDDFAKTIVGKQIAVDGAIMSYAGRDEALQGRPQMTLKSSAALEIMPANAATRPTMNDERN